MKTESGFRVSPEETRITVSERKTKLVEEVTGEEVSEKYAKSMLVGILDPMTRQHTAIHHGNKATCEQLKKMVLESSPTTLPADRTRYR